MQKIEVTNDHTRQSTTDHKVSDRQREAINEKKIRLSAVSVAWPANLRHSGRGILQSDAGIVARPLHVPFTLNEAIISGRPAPRLKLSW